MKRALRFSLALQIATAVLFGITSAQAQSLLWAKSILGDFALGEIVRSGSVAVDKYGSVYIAGTFGGSIDFDPGPGIYNLTSANNVRSWDLFVAKFGKGGNLIWARRFGGARRDGGADLAIAQDGNIYVTGRTRAIGADELFIAKLAPGGRTLWIKRVSEAAGRSIAVDPSGT
jgi:hypothetical protein